MKEDCKYFLGKTKIKKKKGCKCNKTYEEVLINACKCSLFGKVKEKICDGCKRYRSK